MPYFQGDDEYTHSIYKIVKTRKSHECCSVLGDPHEVVAGTRMILETAIHPDDGRVSCYLCLDCANECLEDVYDDYELEIYESTKA